MYPSLPSCDATRKQLYRETVCVQTKRRQRVQLCRNTDVTYHMSKARASASFEYRNVL